MTPLDTGGEGTIFGDGGPQGFLLKTQEINTIPRVEVNVLFSFGAAHSRKKTIGQDVRQSYGSGTEQRQEGEKISHP